MKILLSFFFIFISMLLYAQPGELDLTFGNGGMVTTHFGVCVKGHAVSVDGNGKIIVAGSYRTDSTSYKKDMILVRYNTDGRIDSTFDSEGIVTADLGDYDEANAVLIQPDGKIVLAGYTDNWNSYTDVVLIRYNQDGSLDNAFGNTGITIVSLSDGDDKIAAAVLQPNGKIVVVGSLFNGNDDDYFVARFNADGSLDQSFGSNGVTQVDYDNQNQEGESIVVQEDGKILVGGYSYESFAANFMVARFTSSGIPDSAFGTDGKTLTDLGGDDQGFGMVIQPDGKILQNGFTFSNYNRDVALVRYNSDGSPDYSFGNSGMTVTNVGGLEDDSRSIAVQADGKILLAGSSRISFATDFILLRYNTDGTIDSTFDGDGIVTTDFGGTSAYALASVFQNDQKIILAGVSDLSIAVARYQLELSLDIPDFSQQKANALIYPNPVTSQTVLEYKLIKDETITTSMFDMNGKLVQVFYSKQKKMAGRHEEVLKINKSLAAGNYYVSISNGSESMQIQIAKQ